MNKFIDKSLHNMALAFFYSLMQSFVSRINAIDTQLERLLTLRAELNNRFQAFDTAYKQSLKSQLTHTIAALDKLRDGYAWVIEHVAILWEDKLDEDELNIHGRRVRQVFKDFQFRVEEALLAENSKVENIEQRFAEATLAADLETMGLTELNNRLISATAQIKELMSQRNEENSAIVAGEVKRTRLALEKLYAQMITYLNAVQEIMPEESISQAAQYYNEDFRKVELQIAQSKKKGSKGNSSVTPKPSGEDNSENTENNGSDENNGNGGGTNNGDEPIPDDPDDNGGGTNTNPTNPTNGGDEPIPDGD